LTRIELIATDGTLQQKLLWIVANKNGVYAGFSREGESSHLSYHRDGNMFATTPGKAIKVRHGQSLDEFRNMEEISSFAFTTNLSQFRGDFARYELKEVDAIVYLDMQSIRKKHDFVSCLVELLEPQRLDLLKVFTEFSTGLKQIQIFTDYQPWIAILILGMERKN